MTAPPRDPAKRILVVDDHLLNCVVLDRQLEQIGYSCDIADSARTALALAAARRYGAMILDRRLPDIDGIALTGQLRALGVTAPIIGLTADPLPDPRQWLDAGAQKQLTKPLTLTELNAALGPLPAADSDDPPGPVAPIDFHRLGEILGTERRSDHFDILGFFRRSTAPVLERLEVDLQAEDRDALRRDAHRIKGAAANAGALCLSELMALIEQQAASGDRLILSSLIRGGQCQFKAIEALIDKGAD